MFRLIDSSMIYVSRGIRFDQSLGTIKAKPGLVGCVKWVGLKVMGIKPGLRLLACGKCCYCL